MSDDLRARVVETLSRERTPMRDRRNRATTSGIIWLPPEDVPGGVLSPEAQQRLDRDLRAITEHVARARVSARSYVIY